MFDTDMGWDGWGKRRKGHAETTVQWDRIGQKLACYETGAFT